MLAVVGWLPLRLLCWGLFGNICIVFLLVAVDLYCVALYWLPYLPFEIYWFLLMLRTSRSRFSFKRFTANVIYSLRLADSDILCIISGNLC